VAGKLCSVFSSCRPRRRTHDGMTHEDGLMAMATRRGRWVSAKATAHAEATGGRCRLGAHARVAQHGSPAVAAAPRSVCCLVHAHPCWDGSSRHLPRCTSVTRTPSFPPLLLRMRVGGALLGSDIGMSYDSRGLLFSCRTRALACALHVRRAPRKPNQDMNNLLPNFTSNIYILFHTQLDTNTPFRRCTIR
jgi:hypothetical protein